VKLHRLHRAADLEGRLHADMRAIEERGSDPDPELADVPADGRGLEVQRGRSGREAAVVGGGGDVFNTRISRAGRNVLGRGGEILPCRAIPVAWHLSCCFLDALDM